MKKSIPVFNKRGEKCGEARLGRVAATTATAALATEERRKIVRGSDVPATAESAAAQYEQVGIWGRGKRSFNFA